MGLDECGLSAYHFIALVGLNFLSVKEMQIGMSEEGLRIIQENPYRHLKHVGKRFAAVLYTWKVAKGWNKATKNRDALYTIFITLGTVLALFFSSARQKGAVLLFGVSLSMLLFVSFYHLDGDFKVRLPIHIPLTLCGCLGWACIFDRARCLLHDASSLSCNNLVKP